VADKSYLFGEMPYFWVVTLCSFVCEFGNRVCKPDFKEELFYYVMAVRPFVGSWQLFQFLDRIHSRQDPFDGGSVSYKAATYTQNNINTE
jgi:hypothetical protein